MEIVLPPGANKDFSIGEAFRFGWQVTRANIGFLLGFLVLACIAQYLPNILEGLTKKQYPFLSLFFEILSWVVSIIVGIGYVKTGLRLANNEKGEFSDLYTHWPLFIRYLVMVILKYLAILGGFLLLIIPGIILSVRLQFSSYLLVDKNMGPLESLKNSFALTKGVTMKLLLFTLVAFLINVAGAVCLLVGLLVTIPITWFACVFLYKKFISAPGVSI